MFPQVEYFLNFIFCVFVLVEIISAYRVLNYYWWVFIKRCNFMKIPLLFYRKIDLVGWGM